MTPARLASQPQTISPADARAIGVPARRVRVARRSEGRRSVVMRAVPVGSMRAAAQGEWLTQVRAHAATAHLRADSRATVLRVAELLAWTAAWDTMTTRPTWDVLVERSGRSRATVARALGRLRAAGLLGVVATGRAAQYARTKDGGAEAAVYVLCVPSALAAVDEHETPTSSLAREELTPRTREAASCSSVPLRGAPVAAPAAPSAPEPVAGGHAPRLARPSGLTSVPSRPDGEHGAGRTAALNGRRAIAAELRDRLPVLRRISERHVAAIVREFVLAGWTTSELVAAIDRRPDGPWHHDGANGVGNVGAWLSFRLDAWRDDAGTVRLSPTQRANAERHRIAAERRARLEQLDVEVARPDSPALAAIRAAIDNARRYR